MWAVFLLVKSATYKKYLKRGLDRFGGGGKMLAMFGSEHIAAKADCLPRS
jgi:hypothetical protein